MKTHQTHQMSKKVLNWAYCAHCGLIALRNDVTLIALGKRCPGSV